VLVAAITLPWVLWALVRTFGLDAGYPLVAMIAFTPYAAATALVPLVLALVAREWLVAGVAALALLALVVAVALRAFGGGEAAARADRADGQRLVVMSANLRFGEADAASLLALAREQDVDLLSLQELTPDAVERLDAAGARRLLPGRALAPRRGAAGTGLMARRPLRLSSSRSPRAARSCARRSRWPAAASCGSSRCTPSRRSRAAASAPGGRCCARCPTRATAAGRTC